MSESRYKTGDMVEFKKGGYGLIVDHKTIDQKMFQEWQGVIRPRPLNEYNKPWRVNLSSGEQKWYSANSFKRKI